MSFNTETLKAQTTINLTTESGLILKNTPGEFQPIKLHEETIEWTMLNEYKQTYNYFRTIHPMKVALLILLFAE